MAPCRVLVLRCCRDERLRAALQAIRTWSPRPEIWLLTHRPLPTGDPLGSLIDHDVSCAGTRFGPLRTPVRLIRRLRRLRFHTVAIPWMTPDDAWKYRNVHLLAALLGAERVLVLPGDAAAWQKPARAFRRWIVGVALDRLRDRVLDPCVRAAGRMQAWVDPPLFLLAMMLACLRPRLRRSRASKAAAPRRILYVVDTLSVGGTQRQIAEVLARLPTDRYRVDVVTLAPDSGAAGWGTGPLTAPARVVKSFPGLCASVRELFHLCRRERYDVVHTWLFYSNTIGAAAARLAGCRRVVTSVRSVNPGRYTWSRAWWFRAADYLSSRVADVVTVNAPALVPDHARWARLHPDMIAVVPNGLDVSDPGVEDADSRAWLRRELRLPAGAILVGTVGRLAVEKNHAAFLEIVRRVRRINPRVHGLIVGEGPLRQALAAQAGGRSDGINLLGERLDARRIIAGLDLFLLTSIIEGLPNVLIEAAALGVPIVATEVGGVPDIVTDPEDRFAPADLGRAADRIIATVGDLDAARRAATARRAAVRERFAVARTVERWIDLYAAA